ncbi:putative calcium-binding protein CML45 [Glycine max]|nr:putative calcium-binding protein CML45 [Glycine max]
MSPKSKNKNIIREVTRTSLLAYEAKAIPISLELVSLDYIERSARVSKEDVVLVMEKLGINAELCDDGIEEFGLKIIGELFDDEDVNLSEVEQAFDVFDQNKDGFIEARELQRVLSCLGLGKDLMECEEMINAVDQNGDELIDRNEFFRIMEQCFG